MDKVLERAQEFAMAYVELFYDILKGALDWWFGMLEGTWSVLVENERALALDESVALALVLILASFIAVRFTWWVFEQNNCSVYPRNSYDYRGK